MKNETIDTFLQIPTPTGWLQAAVDNVDLLLTDHAHCEKKAAATAMGLIYRYTDRSLLVRKMSKLAREELVHFDKVVNLLEKRGGEFQRLSPGRYANVMYQHITNHEPNKLIDTLIVGAFIEARSCERFRALVDYLDDEIGSYYRRLFLAEQRHFQEYLSLAYHYATFDIDERIQFFAQIEANLVKEHDTLFRFHSGDPLLQPHEVNPPV